MAGKVRHLLNRSGRYFARLVVPADLRRFIGKTELRAALGPDYRTALKLLPGAVAELQRELSAAERKAADAGARPVQLGRYPMTAGQLAASHYAQRMVFDDLLRNDVRYSAIAVDDQLVASLRRAVAGSATDDELAALVGYEVERFRSAGNVTAEAGTDEWRLIARALCVGELESLARAVERDEGDFTGRPEHPLIVNASPPEDAPAPVSIKRLWADYVTARTQIDSMRDGGRRQRPVIDSLRKHLKHDDARRVTRADLLAWRDELMKDLSAKTVNDIYLSTVRSLFAWAHENERLPENVAATVKQPKPRRVKTREVGYTDAEAAVVLSAARHYQPHADERGRVRETPQSVAAKQWAPLICAFTGARISEITQLRKEDVRKDGDRWTLRITPDAGTVKAGGFRDVPLHNQIVSEGFLAFVAARSDGPLFHNATDPARYAAKAQRMSNQIADWLREAKLTPEGLQPNHAWRHRFKTQARDLGADPRIVDAIQGHAGRTAGDNYGDVSITAKLRVIDALPAYKITRT